MCHLLLSINKQLPIGAENRFDELIGAYKQEILEEEETVEQPPMDTARVLVTPPRPSNVSRFLDMELGTPKDPRDVVAPTIQAPQGEEATGLAVVLFPKVKGNKMSYEDSLGALFTQE